MARSSASVVGDGFRKYEVVRSEGPKKHPRGIQMGKSGKHYAASGGIYFNRA
jgi:hypothetical protein